MSEPKRPVFLDEVDWPTVFPWLAVFRSFRAAIHGPKLLLALLLVVLTYLGGRTLDAVWGPRAWSNELVTYRSLPAADFDRWRAAQPEAAWQQVGARLQRVGGRSARDAAREGDFQAADLAIRRHYQPFIDREKDPARRAELTREARREIAEIRSRSPQGIFDTALRFEVDSFDRMINAAIVLRLGLGEWLRSGQAPPDTVAGALFDMAVTGPMWMYHTHPWFLLIYGLVMLLAFALIGGGIVRMAALEAAGVGEVSAVDALRFTAGRVHWFIITPLFPLFLAVVAAVFLTVGGFVFFNLPVLDMLGGLFFAVAILAGFAIAMLLILMAAGMHMFYPALAVEGGDTFDAISRAFGYVIGRPWRWLFYTIVSLVYGAITYMFIGVIIFTTLSMTHRFVRAGVVAELEPQVNRFDAILPPPRLGQLLYEVEWQEGLGLSGKITSGLVWVWVFLLVGCLGAYAISFYYCVNTWIYLLLRRSTDGTDFDEIHRPPARDIRPPDKVEPAPAPAPPASAP